MRNLEGNIEITSDATEPTAQPKTQADVEQPLERHEVNELLPPTSPEELKRLSELILKDGLKVPIVLCDGKILDGWARYQICRQLGIEPKFEDYTGEEPHLHCWSLNVARRHLNQSQTALLAAEMMARLLGGDAAASAKGAAIPSTDPEGDNIVPIGQCDGVPVAGQPVEPPRRGKTRAYLSKLLGVSEGYIQMASDLKKSAPDLCDAVKAGRMNLNQATKKAQRRDGKAASAKKEPSDKLLVKGLVNKICDTLNRTSEPNEVYAELQPIFAWAKEHELRQEALKQRKEEDDAWMVDLQSKFPTQEAA